jgi:hypothetical protein
MAAELHQDRQPTTSLPSDEKKATKQPLEAVVADVRRDSRKDSQLYLDETTVPHGGE